MRKVRIIGKKSKSKLQHLKNMDIKENRWIGLDGPIDSQHLLISMMLPPAVKAFLSQLETEVEHLCGKRYCHGKELHRWGYQEGSIILGNQQVAIERPRVRDKKIKKEVALESYNRFQDPSLFEEAVFTEGLKRVSQRDYKKGIQKMAASFGVSKSSISRKWIRATAKSIERLQERSLKEMDIIAVFIDGKRFRERGVVVALGVSSNGKKYVLGIYQCDTENHVPCLELLNDLEKRGLREDGLLFIVDGGSGLNKALEIKYDIHNPQKRRALRARCYFHKWNNLKKILGDKAEGDIARLFWSMRDAQSMEDAIKCSDSLEDILKTINLSALHSYQNAKDDLLVIHRLRLNQGLKRFFSTTNPIESLNSLTEEDMRRVKKWRNSEHFQRWLATYCLSNEKRMRRPRGFAGLSAMVVALKNLCPGISKSVDIKEKIA